MGSIMNSPRGIRPEIPSMMAAAIEDFITE